MKRKFFLVTLCLMLIGILSPIFVSLLFYSGINTSFVKSVYASKYWSVSLGILILVTIINRVSIGMTSESTLDEREYAVTLRAHYVAFLVSNILLLVYILFFATSILFIVYFILMFVYLLIFEGIRTFFPTN